MNWEVTIAPTSEPLTTAEAKKQCEVPTSVTAHDTFLDTLVKTARIYTENRLGIGLFTQTVVYRWDAFPLVSRWNTFAALDLTPGKIQQVNYLRYLDTDGVWQSLTSATRATGVLTFTGIPSDTETVTINSTVYTFQTTLTDVAGNVLIGASATECARNLAAAINLDSGAGLYYAASTIRNTDVTADYLAGVLTVTAILETSAPNSYATTETLTNASWGGATLSGGMSDGVDYIQALTEKPAKLVPAYEKTWPSVRPQVNSIECEFVRGWSSTANIPETLKQAMLMMVNTWFECRNDPVRRFPTAAGLLLDQYRERYL